MSRLFAYVFGLGTLAAVWSPALGPPQADSYPLSTYPMFASKRERPRLYFVEVVDSSGKRRRVAPEFIANDEVMQAAATVRRAVNGGEGPMRALCERAAARVQGSARYPGARQIELASAEYDPVAYFVQGPEPIAPTTHFQCAVPSPP